MGLMLVCDGCGAPLSPEAASTFGALETVCYCVACASVWRTHVRAEDAERVRLVTAFEAWRHAALEALRGLPTTEPVDTQQHPGLRRLPDE